MNFEAPPRTRPARVGLSDAMDVKHLIDVRQTARGLTECATVRNRTLWEAVLDFLAEQGSVTRERLFERFGQDPAEDVGDVLNELIGHGIVDRARRGASTVYELSSASRSSSSWCSSW